jgi:diadenosine tetraphosphatase ApaH/serine/threonine PP2A family protein phosphatase
MRAILSDIHGNLEALAAVLGDAACHQAEELYCLGDTVGYGPNPVECLDVTMSMQVVLLGNYDSGALFDAEGFPVFAERSIFWTRRMLESAGGDQRLRERRIDFLMTRLPSHEEQDLLFVHGSPRNPLNEYVFPEDIYNQKKITRIAAKRKHYCFNGHTHVPGIFVEERPQAWRYFSPADCGSVYRLDGRKTICNVGSVGQPRDGDWRACYVLFGGEVIRFRRVEYDIETTIKKIYAISELENWLGDRLRDGQ